jgi:NAD(P)-dependent dehydrogenase (short-subunit alcohol dehydrogenase family)
VSVLSLFRLTGRVAIVTGASSGLGVSFAEALAEAGASVVLTARRADRLHAVAERIEAAGGSALVVRSDVSDPDACTGVTDAALERYGRVDILINNAGIATSVPATRESPADFRHVVDVNLHGAYWMAQACGRIMKPGSSIINVSSILGITTARLPHAAYSSSKAALLGLTRDLAQQWTGRKGIRVNAVAPGFFQTEMTDQYEDGYLDTLRPRMLVPRLGRLEELAATVVWLAGDAAGYVTGQTIVVDGGVTITLRGTRSSPRTYGCRKPDSVGPVRRRSA